MPLELFLSLYADKAIAFLKFFERNQPRIERLLNWFEDYHKEIAENAIRESRVASFIKHQT